MEKQKINEIKTRDSGETFTQERAMSFRKG